jgi:hypothetical protein
MPAARSALMLGPYTDLWTITIDNIRKKCIVGMDPPISRYLGKDENAMHSRRVLFTLITATLIYAGCGPMSSTVSVNDTTNPQRIQQAAQDYLSYRGTTQEMAKARAFLSTL